VCTKNRLFCRIYLTGLRISSSLRPLAFYILILTVLRLSVEIYSALCVYYSFYTFMSESAYVLKSDQADVLSVIVSHTEDIKGTETIFRMTYFIYNMESVNYVKKCSCIRHAI
jgi:hypothetical protein